MKGERCFLRACLTLLPELSNEIHRQKRFGTCSIKNHENGLLNPKAHIRKRSPLRMFELAR